MFNNIKSIKQRDPAARNYFEIFTTYPGLHAIYFYKVANFLWRIKLKWLARFISFISRMLTGIEIHPAAKIGKGFVIDHGMGIVIGETAEIGENVTIYHGVTIGGVSWNPGKRHPTLEDGVVVGAGAKVLGPITIGKNAKIGSNSVVTKNVKANATVIGVPAHTADSKNGHAFCAYGLNKNAEDPVMEHFNAMAEEIAELKQQLQQLQQLQQQSFNK